MKESAFQAALIKDIRKLFPGCIVLKNDPTYLQGMPDILVLHGKHWAALECKRDESSGHQPNQDYYVRLLNDMSYASFIFPSNKEVVLRELREALEP